MERRKEAAEELGNKIIRMRVDSVKALSKKVLFGRYLKYQYGLQTTYWNVMWGVQADCEEYTANWDQDSRDWYKVDDPDMYLKPGENSSQFNSATEAKVVLDEFCPLIDSLPKGGEVD